MGSLTVGAGTGAHSRETEGPRLCGPPDFPALPAFQPSVCMPPAGASRWRAPLAAPAGKVVRCGPVAVLSSRLLCPCLAVGGRAIRWIVLRVRTARKLWSGSWGREGCCARSHQCCSLPFVCTPTFVGLQPPSGLLEKGARSLAQNGGRRDVEQLVCLVNWSDTADRVAQILPEMLRTVDAGGCMYVGSTGRGPARPIYPCTSASASRSGSDFDVTLIWIQLGSGQRQTRGPSRSFQRPALGRHPLLGPAIAKTNSRGRLPRRTPGSMQCRRPGSRQKLPYTQTQVRGPGWRASSDIDPSARVRARGAEHGPNRSPSAHRFGRPPSAGHPRERTLRRESSGVSLDAPPAATSERPG